MTDNVVHLGAHRARYAGPLALPPKLGDLVDESDRLDRLELERDVRLYRSRRRRAAAAARERRRDRIAGAIVVALGALCVYLGAGGAAWPS